MDDEMSKRFVRPIRAYMGAVGFSGWTVWVTWVLFLLVINLPLLDGGVNSRLLFLPGPVLEGEWWRILLHPFVHASWYHLLLDGSAFLYLLSSLEEKCSVSIGCYIAGAGGGALLATWCFEPTVWSTGLCGLSGSAHGLMAISALEMIRGTKERGLGLACLVAVVVKAGYESISGHVLFEFMHLEMCGIPLGVSHGGGVAGGVLVFLLVRGIRAVPGLRLPVTTVCRSAARSVRPFQT